MPLHYAAVAKTGKGWTSRMQVVYRPPMSAIDKPSQPTPVELKTLIGVHPDSFYGGDNDLNTLFARRYSKSQCIGEINMATQALWKDDRARLSREGYDDNPDAFKKAWRKGRFSDLCGNQATSLMIHGQQGILPFCDKCLQYAHYNGIIMTVALPGFGGSDPLKMSMNKFVRLLTVCMNLNEFASNEAFR